MNIKINTNNQGLVISSGQEDKDTPYTYPKKLKIGDEVRIIAPSISMAKWPQDVISLATSRLEEMGLVVSFGKNVREIDDFDSSPIESRLEDLYSAFKDSNVKGILCSSGGYNANYLLDKIDWQVIKDNPKFFCGFSDITVLSNAILKKTGLITYSGPNFRNFGQKKYVDYTLSYFEKMAFRDSPLIIRPSPSWSDDNWIKNQDKRELIKNEGFWLINPGKASGQIIGGNLCSLNLLQGTSYMPSLKNSVLLIEDDSMSTAGEFSRNLQSLAQLPDFSGIKAILFGRFQKKTKMTRKLLTALVKSLPQLDQLPVLANLDFGHTDPKFTFPIGATISIDLQKLKL